jgi:hypothetical protein
VRVGLCLVVAATLLGTADASAYVLQRTETGAAVHWPHTCVSWWMEGQGCPDVTPTETLETLRASFEKWDALEAVYVDFEEAGVSCIDTVGMDLQGPLNVMMWRSGIDGWPHTDRVVGLTTLTLDINTGEIVDADVEFNAEDFTFAIDGDGNAYDLQHAVTHEIGHVLGLDHSTDPSSVMFETADPGAVDKRELAPDDIEGVTMNHGWAEAPPTESCGTPPRGTPESPYCPPAAAGCGAGGDSDVPLASLLLLMMWVCGAWRRRGCRWHASVVSACICVSLMPTPASAQECNPYNVPGGAPIYWPEARVELSVDPRLPPSVTSEQMLDSVHVSLEAWTELPCARPEVDVLDQDEGFAACPGEVLDDSIQCIYWALPGDEWTYGSALIAVTLVHHNTLTAEIIDTDMAINGTGPFTWSSLAVCDPDSPDHDLPATLTHEFGHFFGLDHSGHAQSVMEGATRPGDCDKRTLADFDTDCLCDTLASVPRPVADVPDIMEGDVSGADSASTDGGQGGDDVALPPPPRGGCTGGRTGHGPAPLMWLSLLSLVHLARRRLRPGSRAAPAR